jgi:hypothetical protein
MADCSWSLHAEGRRGAVLHIVHDEVHPQMWRVRDCDGRPVRHGELSRANDAGGIMALGILKLPAGDRLPADWPDKNEATELVATSLPDAPKRLPEALSDAEMASGRFKACGR